MIKNRYIIAAIVCFLISILHTLVILNGEKWYIFFGAGKEFAEMAKAGMLYPKILTGFISLTFVVLTFYILAKDGFLKLPYTNFITKFFGIIFVIRGGYAILFYPFKNLVADNQEMASFFNRPYFVFITSIISLLLGIVFLSKKRTS